MIGLEPEPEPLGHAKVPAQTQVRIGGDGAFAEHDFIDPAWGHSDRAREAVLSKAHGLDEIEQQNLAGWDSV